MPTEASENMRGIGNNLIIMRGTASNWKRMRPDIDLSEPESCLLRFPRRGA